MMSYYIQVWGRRADEGRLEENIFARNGAYRESFLATITEETPESEAFVAEPGYFISKGRKSCSVWAATLGVVYHSLVTKT